MAQKAPSTYTDWSRAETMVPLSRPVKEMAPLYTAQQVIEMFHEMNLPVTDDAKAIEDEVNKQRARRLRQQNSPDPRERLEAHEWFRNVTLLKNRHSEMIEVVQRYFNQLADEVLASVLNTGAGELPTGIYDNLREIARKECHLDDSLTQQFVEAYDPRFVKRIVLPPVEPKLVEALTAMPEVGRIALRWKLPLDMCDGIVLRRQEGRKKGQSSTQAGKELCRGNRTEYVDTNVTSGQWYTYSVCSLFRGTESKDSQQVEAMAIGEVLFSGVPQFVNGEAILFDSSREQDANKLPGTTILSHLAVRFPGGTPERERLDPGLGLLIFVDDLSAPRARVRLVDLIQQGGERPLNLLRQAGQVVRIVLIDPARVWTCRAPQIEVELG